MKTKTIYPKVEITQKDGIISFKTFLRKQRQDEKWYFIPCVFESGLPIEEAINYFNCEIYSLIVLGNVSEKCELDQNDVTEKRRLQHIFMRKLSGSSDYLEPQKVRVIDFKGTNKPQSETEENI